MCCILKFYLFFGPCVSMVVISLRMTMKVTQLVEQVIMEKYIYKVYLELIEIIIFAFVAKEDKIDCNITYEINFFFFFLQHHLHYCQAPIETSSPSTKILHNRLEPFLITKNLWIPSEIFPWMFRMHLRYPLQPPVSILIYWFLFSSVLWNWKCLFLFVRD